ncbi:Uncharacterized protein Fot_12325 [Forsythia ovata]|uniref:Uncharacterized protein n=1 Tax=Forsythia ovata TaxID=205694 RepID=A0ABD1WMV0_9LAMI
MGLEEGDFGGLKSIKRKEKMKFGSWRWGSFKEDAKSVRDSFDFSTSLRDVLKNDKITRISRRRSSFFSFSNKNSKSWNDQGQWTWKWTGYNGEYVAALHVSISISMQRSTILQQDGSAIEWQTTKVTFSK